MHTRLVVLKEMPPYIRAKFRKVTIIRNLACDHDVGMQFGMQFWLSAFVCKLKALVNLRTAQTFVE